MIVVFAMMTVMNVNAQDNNIQPYYELDQMPKLIEIMPAPPAFDSPEFANDIVRYGWGNQPASSTLMEHLPMRIRMVW